MMAHVHSSSLHMFLSSYKHSLIKIYVINYFIHWPADISNGCTHENIVAFTFSTMCTVETSHLC